MCVCVCDQKKTSVLVYTITCHLLVNYACSCALYVARIFAKSIELYRERYILLMPGFSVDMEYTQGE